jgi:CRISPR/Cas system CMR-associated protein Cmr5 small subunit
MPARPKFQFKILTGANEAACKAKYDAILAHDPYTFYLFDKGGVGYLGDTPLFVSDASKFNMLNTNVNFSDLRPNSFYFVTADCLIKDGLTPTVTSYEAKIGSIWFTNASSVPTEVSWTSFNTDMARYIAASAVKAADITDATYSGNETSVMTSAAVATLIAEKINAQAILGISFFKNVQVVTLKPADIASSPKVVTFTVDGTSYTAPLSASDHEGDIGLVFQLQYGPEYDPSDSDGDAWVFVNLHGLINLYVGSVSNTATTTITHDSTDPSGHTKKVTVEVNKSTDSALYSKILTAADTIAIGGTYDPTDITGDGLSNNKFITESQLADVMAKVLSEYVKYSAD